jgi:CRP/FNR family cyclic AMP-dependent transcriptional regulator
MNETVKGLETILQKHDFFKELQPEHIELLAGCAKNLVFKPGEHVFRQGQGADHFFAIRQGQVSLELSAAGKGTIVLGTVGENEVMGWSWYVAPHRWRYSGRATQLTRVLAFEADCVRKKCDEDHQLGHVFLKQIVSILAHRLEATRMQLLDVYGSEE